MKKIFSLLLLFIPLVALITACEHDEEDPITTTSPYSKYKGAWVGTYSGSDSGEIEFNVKNDGTVIGTVESENFTDLELSLKGKVSIQGEVKLIFINTNEDGNEEEIGSFTGTMSETHSSGTWVNDSKGIKGIWVAGR